ncbi:MAG: glycosyltransferase family 4 protein [Candidatus Rokubacteria bacterium]|nr:glycosyltransferase family 4 protein [Candidatus Rokubacteria bacterium]
MRVLHVYPKHDYFTGAAMQLTDLARGLRERGHHVVVCTRPSAVWATECRRLGLLHCTLPMRRGVELRSILGLRRLVSEHGIEIVHAHKGRARTLALLAGLAGRRPRLVLNRGVSFPVRRWTRLGYTSRRVDAVVAVCESIKRGLVAAGVPAAKIDVIYSGTDTERFHPGVDGGAVRRELGLDAADFLVTQVGVRSWRGWADVLDAVTRLAPAAPRLRLLFVGAAPPRVAALGDLARARGLGGRVLVLGSRRDVPQILAASDVVVDASYQGLGITGSIREALACERPVIATAVEGMPELVRDGETGLLVPPRDPAALAAAIRRVLDDPTGAHALARAGRKRVEAHFSLRAKLDATEALYRRLLDRRARP